MASQWTAADIPDQHGRTAIVTGANSGIGLETARELARKGARVILACRNADKAEAALAEIRATVPDANVEFEQLDLSRLDSVRAFAQRIRDAFDQIDLLINNAGVMMTPLSRTADGFELQFGTNHLGHFALTGLLLDRIRDVPGARIVSVSSMAHRFGRIDFDNLNAEKKYNRTAAYGQSKLANLLFIYELQRRLTAAGAQAIATAAHPGWTRTNLQEGVALFKLFNPIFGQLPPTGALPTLYAATATDAEPAGYYGPSGFLEMRGTPKRVGSTAASRDRETQRRLWQVSEELTGIRYDLPAVD
ncbi:MAG: SDR family NAD(P)-dependent oxidoreductase [Candidatus Dadabacteria bacterium]|nr:MAG: SDR family NAD(P)-dependent oxidoreductase [Candidatus Dadabacteria bacterium]